MQSSFVGKSLTATLPRPQGTGHRMVTCMAKKKGVRIIVTLECTEAKNAGATPSRYTTQKNKKNTPERIELMKYNPHMQKYTLHKEVK